MTSVATSKLKNQLRQKARQQRQALTMEQRLKYDIELAKQFLKFTAEKTFHRTALYIQQDGELGTEHLIEKLLAMGSQLYLPKLFEDGSNQLHFVRYDQNSRMAKNCFGIPEPISNEKIPIDELELIFMPLTAFDLQGNRLGMGGGYYDRTLAKALNKNTLFIGLAYDFQQIPACPVDTFDQPLDMVLTPTRAIEFNL